jgi:hypothetical protein
VDDRDSLDGLDGLDESPLATEHGNWAERSRNETEEQRLDRNFLYLLQELRVAQTGVQILFAFLLTLVFQARFGVVETGGLVLYGIALAAAASAMALLIAPVANHRLLFRRRMMHEIVDLAHRTTLAGLALLFVAVEGSLLLACENAFGWAAGIVITLLVGLVFAGSWLVLPLSLRRRRQAHDAPDNR